MKSLLLPLASLILSLGCWVPCASAIPDNIGGAFFTAFHSSFEDFATNPENYTITAAGRPHWAPDAEAAGGHVLQLPATVFGLPAKRIILEEANDRVLRYQVEFDPSSSDGNVFHSVLTNVEAYAGVKPVNAGETKRKFPLPDVTITVQKHATGLVTVEFRRNL